MNPTKEDVITAIANGKDNPDLFLEAVRISMGEYQNNTFYDDLLRLVNLDFIDAISTMYMKGYRATLDDDGEILLTQPPEIN